MGYGVPWRCLARMTGSQGLGEQGIGWRSRADAGGAAVSRPSLEHNDSNTMLDGSCSPSLLPTVAYPIRSYVQKVGSTIAARRMLHLDAYSRLPHHQSRPLPYHLPNFAAGSLPPLFEHQGAQQRGQIAAATRDRGAPPSPAIGDVCHPPRQQHFRATGPVRCLGVAGDYCQCDY